MLAILSSPSYYRIPDYVRLFTEVHEHKYTDLHLQSGHCIMASKNGQMHCLNERLLSNQELQDCINYLYGNNAVSLMLRGQDLDFSYCVPENRKLRFRVNACACYFGHDTGIQISMRILADTPPSLSELNFPSKLHELTAIHEGIVLVCGTTGSGKSTLLASMIKHRLAISQKGEKVITLEAPIEYLFQEDDNHKCMVSQTEIPKHLPNFPTAVRNTLRRAPTLIMVSESRDYQTISAVVESALTGHAVYTTLHSGGIVETFNRVVMMFPESERQRVRYDFILSLRGIIWQSLIPNKRGGRAAWREWVVFDEISRQKLLNHQGSTHAELIKLLITEQSSDRYTNLTKLLQAGEIDQTTYNQYLQYSNGPQILMASGNNGKLKKYELF